ncbi:MAG: hypothetical protein GC155_02465 [Alphaproteobacteria bacterium]|nr:hypothetical protein [Alphaproteobacteria bacterium]
MAATLKSAETEARSILQQWVEASAVTQNTPAGGAEMFRVDQEMMGRIAAVFEVTPTPLETATAAWTLSCMRVTLGASLSLNPWAVAARLEAMERTTRKTGEAMIDLYRSRSPLK